MLEKLGFGTKLLIVFLVVVVAWVALLNGGCAINSRSRSHVETSRTEVELGPQTRVVLENSRGKIELTESEDGRVSVKATKRTRARSEEKARDIANEIEVELLREGDDLRILVSYPGNLRNTRSQIIVMGFDITNAGGSVDLMVAIPRGTAVRVLTRSGDLDVPEYSGSLDFESSSGDIRLDDFVGDVIVTSRSGKVWISNLEGDLEMQTSSGDLSAKSIQGSVRFDATGGDLDVGEITGDLLVTTASGDIEVGEVVGRVNVRTTSGDISVRKSSGQVEATTASGDVYARVVVPLEDIYVRTSSGDVTLVLYEPLRGRLDVSTSSGRVNALLPMSVEMVSRVRLLAVLGPGDGSVEVKTSSGDVEILRAE